MQRGKRGGVRGDGTRNVFRFPAERVRRDSGVRAPDPSAARGIDPGAIVEPATIVILTRDPSVTSTHFAHARPDDDGGRAA